MGNGTEFTSTAVARGGFSVISLLTELEKRSASGTCLLSDARQSPLSDGSVDAVITSPPYINVFNYHQNYRPAVEMLGWRPLQAAPSEIGANRKHRMNRFLTVIQYCLDMRLSLRETARVMRPNAPLIIVLGRTSNVLGASFRNGEIIRSLLKSSGCFGEAETAQRVFTNRFGERIFEDIFVCHRHAVCSLGDDDAREVGIAELERALPDVSGKNRLLLLDAIAVAPELKPSPTLNIAIPQIFEQMNSNRKIGNGSYPHSRARG
jgi:hypothetical protein